MSTMAIKSAVTMDHVKSGKKADFVSRFKKYMEDNVAYFAAGSAMTVSYTHLTLPTILLV